MKPTVRHRTAVLSLIAAVVVCAAVSVGRAASSQDRNEAQEQELMSLGTIIAAALTGQIVPTGEPFDWANDSLKAYDQQTFVPFTLSVDQSKVSTSAVAMYIFVAPQGGPAAAPATGASATSALPKAAFEDAYHVDLGAPTADGVYEIRRGFSAPSGDYDVYVALSESGVSDGTEAKTMMLKQAVSVPDLWSDTLATSSVILVDRIESLSAPLPPDQHLANPYVLGGTTRLVPRSDRMYLASEELSTFFLIYNVGLTSDGLPDVTVEFNFHTPAPEWATFREAIAVLMGYPGLSTTPSLAAAPLALGASLVSGLLDGDVFFNTSGTQTFNAQTLPYGFDYAGGHQLQAGQVVPLASFPAADYRLEIKITDRTNSASLLLNVDFSVSAS